jgi:predicted nucleic acid-binding protein
VNAAYVDSSFLVAILLGEPGSRALRTRLGRFDDLLAGDLLVAELLSTAARESLAPEQVTRALGNVDLVLPDRSLEPEMLEVLQQGRLRGADLWHLACALYLAGEEREALAFLSRDAPQRELARRLGFPTP